MDEPGMRARMRAAAVAIVFWALSALDLRTASAAEAHFHIDAGDAAAALNEYSRQSNLQVLFDYNVLVGRTTQAIDGDYQPAEALRQMLVGTQLVFDFVNDHTLAVTPDTEGVNAATGAPHVAAHAMSAPPPPSTGPPPASHQSAPEQVLVTSSRAGGSAPAILEGPLYRFTQQEIERSGAQTLAEFLQTLPQVSRAGPNEDTQLGRETLTNSSKAVGLNLRSLGAGASLVLLDGRRIAPSGTAGAYVDISQVPLSAIDHIEIYPSGTGTIYGADAVAGVVNLVTRKFFQGAETQGSYGHVTSGGLGSAQLSQLLGLDFTRGHAFVGLDYQHRDRLPASARSQATSNLIPFGGNNFDSNFGNPGTILVNGQTYALPSGQNGKNLSPTSLIAGTQNLYDRWAGVDVLPQQDRLSGLASFRYSLTDSVTAFFDLLLTDRHVSVRDAAFTATLSVPASNPFYVSPVPGSAPVEVLYGFTNDFGADNWTNDIHDGNTALGALIDVGHGWSLNSSLGESFEHQHQHVHGLVNYSALNAALADPDPVTAFDPFGAGSYTAAATLARIRSEGIYRLRSNVVSVDSVAKGPLLALPAGVASLTVGAQYRQQTFDSVTQQTPTPAAAGAFSRRVLSFFTQATLPLIGPGDTPAGPAHLALLGGLRYENFSDVGSASAPHIGLVWSPTPDWMLRADWGKSSRAPNLPDRDEAQNESALFVLPDPKSPSGQTTVLAVTGNNADLRPEMAHSLNLGAQFTPRFLPGLLLALTFYDTTIAGRVEESFLSTNVLQDPTMAWAVTRNVPAQQRASVCARSTFRGSTAECLNAPIGALVDVRLHNVEDLRVRGLDLNARYTIQGAAGNVELGLNGSYVLQYVEQQTPNSPLVELRNTQNNPVALRLRSALTWTYGGATIALFGNFTGGYHDTASVPERSVGAWRTWDLQLGYEWGSARADWLARLQLALSVQNVLNAPAPFLNNAAVGVGYDQENASLLGRMVSLRVRKAF